MKEIAIKTAITLPMIVLTSTQFGIGEWQWWAFMLLLPVTLAADRMYERCS